MTARILSTGVFLLVTLTLHAQHYTIDWHTTDGGGGTSAGGAYSVSSTIGQPDAGPAMRGGNFSLTGGFWSPLAVQMPGAPLLSISLTSTNTVMITWPSPSAGFGLQQSANLNPANWMTTPEPVIDNGTSRFIIVNPAAGNRFYRLFKP